LSVCASMHICVSLSCYLEASTVLVVSCPDPFPRERVGSGHETMVLGAWMHLLCLRGIG